MKNSQVLPMQFGSINLHLWDTRWAAGTGLGLGGGKKTGAQRQKVRGSF